MGKTNKVNKKTCFNCVNCTVTGAEMYCFCEKKQYSVVVFCANNCEGFTRKENEMKPAINFVELSEGTSLRSTLILRDCWYTATSDLCELYEGGVASLDEIANFILFDGTVEEIVEVFNCEIGGSLVWFRDTVCFNAPPKWQEVYIKVFEQLRRDEVVQISSVHNEEMEEEVEQVRVVYSNTGEVVYMSEEEERHLTHCAHCDEPVDTEQDYVEVEGYIYCDVCCAERDDARWCEGCQEWRFDNEDGVELDSGEWYHSRQCAWDNDLGQCDECGEWGSCYEDLYYNERRDGWYCEDCNRSNTLVREYHEGRGLGTYNFQFRGDTKGKLPYLGIELELNGGGNVDSFAERFFSHYDETEFILSEDSTVDVEIVSSPSTWMEHFTKNYWSNIQSLARLDSFSSVCLNSNISAGIHVNMSLPLTEGDELKVIGVRMLRTLERFKNFFEVLSRRGDMEWAYIPEYKTIKDYVAIGVTDYDKIMNEEYTRYGNDHHCAVNLSHIYKGSAARIELRLFGGTLDTNLLYSDMAIAEGLLLLCKNTSEVFIESWTLGQMVQNLLKALKDADDYVAYLYAYEYLTNFMKYNGFES